MGLFTRDGHLLDLSLERHQAEDLSPEETVELQTHLQHCPECQQRKESLSPQEILPPLRKTAPSLTLITGGARSPEPARNPLRHLRWVVPALALAAGALLFIQPSPEHFTSRGGNDLIMEVYRETESISQRLLDGDTVHAGDKLGFRIRSDQNGYLLIAGKDDKGNTYQCYPQDAQNMAAPLTGGPDAIALSAAIQMDTTIGQEVLTATLCPKPFDFNQATAHPPPEGCTQTTLHLTKKIP